MPLLLLFALFTPAVAQELHNCSMHGEYLRSYENPLNDKWLSAYDVKHYDLSLAVSNQNTEISGEAAILLEARRNIDTVVLELQNALTVSEVRISDQFSPFLFNSLLSFTHEGDAIFIQLDRTRVEEELFAVKVVYGGDAGQDRGFFAGINSNTDSKYGFEVTYTLSEPHNARDWFPVKQVLEDKIDSVTFRIRCDRDLLAGSNGLLKKIEEVGNEHILTWQTTYPMAYYLLSFAVADYQDFSFMAGLSQPGDSVLVQNYIYDSEEVLADWKEEIGATGSLISLFSRLLVDYPFAEEKYGHAMAPMGGGMEHQTMTTLHNFNFFLVAHELAHQWFGDHITCGNWQDIWINEGFASYMEYVAAQHLWGQDAADGWMDNAMSIALGETDGSVFVPEDEVEDVYRLFDYGLSYKKGAILLHMIRFILDDDAQFFSLLRTYLEGHGTGHATGEDFRTILEAESGLDFSSFFEQWYYGEGFPRFVIHWVQQSESLMIRSEQSGSASEVTPLFQVPFELELRFIDGTVQRVRLMQDHSVEEFMVPVEGVVTDVVFDPDNRLLNTSHVSQELPTESAFRFGPNPVAGELYIRFPNITSIDAVRITSLSGQELLTLTHMDNPLTLDLSFLVDGTYLLELSISTGTYQERIVKISTH
jgi:aminopeptidase N